jgi:hypothetical protein
VSPLCERTLRPGSPSACGLFGACVASNEIDRG